MVAFLRRHVVKDLRPYNCTFRDCATRGQLYDSSKDWLRHEVQQHEADMNHRPCPFCFADASAQHIAEHLRRVALFALPRSTGLESDSEEGGSASSQLDLGSRDSGSSSLVFPSPYDSGGEIDEIKPRIAGTILTNDALKTLSVERLTISPEERLLDYLNSNPNPEESRNQQEGRSDPIEQRKQHFGRYPQAVATANLALTIGTHEEHPESSTPVQADASVFKADANIPTHQQDTARVFIVAQEPQHHIDPKSNNAATPSTGSIQALGSSGSRVPLSGQGPLSGETGHERWFERVFYMIIHVGERNAQRVTCLDTGSDFDVISHQVVVDLGLQPEKYTGERVKPLGGIYDPEGQITLDWHVLGFNKTYTTTFAVFSNHYSEGFDVLLGRHTIKKIGFYKKESDVWFSSAEGGVRVPRPISTLAS
ncbi:MAG: hypothetical protein Q9178_001801 [Gyalolechia marmorata]